MDHGEPRRIDTLLLGKISDELADGDDLFAAAQPLEGRSSQRFVWQVVEMDDVRQPQATSQNGTDPAVEALLAGVDQIWTQPAGKVDD